MKQPSRLSAFFPKESFVPEVFCFVPGKSFVPEFFVSFPEKSFSSKILELKLSETFDAFHILTKIHPKSWFWPQNSLKKSICGHDTC